MILFIITPRGSPRELTIPPLYHRSPTIALGNLLLPKALHEHKDQAIAAMRGGSVHWSVFLFWCLGYSLYREIPIQRSLTSWFITSRRRTWQPHARRKALDLLQTTSLNLPGKRHPHHIPNPRPSFNWLVRHQPHTARCFQDPPVLPISGTSRSMRVAYTTGALQQAPRLGQGNWVAFISVRSKSSHWSGWRNRWQSRTWLLGCQESHFSESGNW